MTPDVNVLVAAYRDCVINCPPHGLHGNLVTDAWIASAVETLCEHLVTFDKDFKRLLPTGDFTLLSPYPSRSQRTMPSSNLIAARYR